MTKVILFNGPPRCGKDTSAIRTMNVFNPRFGLVRHDASEIISFDRFAMPIKRAFAGLTNSAIDIFGNVYPYEQAKEQVIPWLGVSYRQWQIDFSEKYMKGYGIDIFGRLFADRVGNSPSRAVVVPDSGFAEEVKPIVEAFGMHNIVLIRIHRPEHDFTGDSRSYLPDGLVRSTYDVNNDGEVIDLNKKIDAIVGDFLDTAG